MSAPVQTQPSTIAAAESAKKSPGRLRPAVIAAAVALVIGAGLGGIVTNAVAVAHTPDRITALEHSAAAYKTRLADSEARLDASGTRLAGAQAKASAASGTITDCQAVETSLRAAAGEMDDAYRQAVSAAMAAKNPQDIVGGLLGLGVTFDTAQASVENTGACG